MTKLIVLVGLLSVIFGATATAATPKRFYWSEEKAEALVVAKGIPYCAIEKSDPKCANGMYRADGHPIMGRWGFEDALCTGADEKGDTFTYARFKCRFLVNYGYFRGRLAVYPTGPKSFRWTLIGVYDCGPARCDSP